MLFLAEPYSTPHLMVEYGDGNKIQGVALSFEAEPIGGELGLSDETTEIGYFTLDEIKKMDVMEHHPQRIHDALAGSQAAFVR